MTAVDHYACVLPRFERSLVIEKGWDGRYAVAISRNGRVLFLSERPLGELADEAVVLAVRPWFRRDGEGRRTARGTSVLVRTATPSRRPVVAAEAIVASSESSSALAVLPLSRSGLLSLLPARGLSGIRPAL